MPEKARRAAPRIVDKPWGREIWYAHNDRYAGKILEVDEGHVLSLQKHNVKHETMYLQSGRMRFTLDDEVFEWMPGETVAIPPGTVHRMEALQNSVILLVPAPIPPETTERVRELMLRYESEHPLPGTLHRIEAFEDSTLLEVSTPHLGDVVRLEDRYGRGQDPTA